MIKCFFKRQLKENDSLSVDPFSHDIIEKQFRVIWTNNANALSFLYAHSNAMKTDITKHGKWTLLGKLADLKTFF